MNTVAIIPLRGGSKGIPGKNIKEIAGKPLCAWVIEAAIESKLISKVYVSTDSLAIKELVENLGLGVIVIDRPSELATDEASSELVVSHFMSQISFDKLVMIQATSPLLTNKDLDLALKSFEANNLDSMVSTVRIKRFFWSEDGVPLNYNPMNRPRRQDFSGMLMENGAFYITKSSILETYNCRLAGHIGVFEMPENTSVEIDEAADWEIVERLLEKRQKI